MTATCPRKPSKWQSWIFKLRSDSKDSFLNYCTYWLGLELLNLILNCPTFILLDERRCTNTEVVIWDKRRDKCYRKGMSITEYRTSGNAIQTGFKQQGSGGYWVFTMCQVLYLYLKYLLGIYHASGTLLSTWDLLQNKTGKYTCLLEFWTLVEEKQ